MRTLWVNKGIFFVVVAFLHFDGYEVFIERRCGLLAGTGVWGREGGVEDFVDGVHEEGKYTCTVNSTFLCPPCSWEEGRCAITLERHRE